MNSKELKSTLHLKHKLNKGKDFAKQNLFKHTYNIPNYIYSHTVPNFMLFKNK